MTDDMNTATIKGQLHDYIERADDKHLQAIYILLEKEMAAQKYDEDTLKELYQRRENHLNGSSASYTIDEALKLVRDHKKNA